MNKVSTLSGFGYFSNKKRAGVETSNIEHQDSVATHMALLLQSQKSPYSELESEDWSIMSEGEDDLEIISQELRVLIQAKKGELTKTGLKEIISNFLETQSRARDSGFNKEFKFQINALGGLSKDLKTLPAKLGELKSRKEVYTKEEYLVSLKEISSAYEIPEKIFEGLHIDVADYFKDSDVSKARFIHLLRAVYPVRIYTDDFAHEIYTSLSSILFSEARRKRTGVTKSEVNKVILSQIAPLNNMSIEMDFVNTKTGYRKVSELTRFLASEKEIFRKVIWNVRVDWLKYYWKRVLRNMLLPSNEICLECKHPLIAGFYGALGLSCPSCGYTPFVSLVFACDCGGYTLIKKQPELGTEQCADYISSYIRNGNIKCDPCGRNIRSELLRRRWLVVPYPLPFTDFTPGKISGYFDND